MINEIPRRSHTRSVGMTNNLLQGFVSLVPIAIGILLPLSKVEMFIDGKSKNKFI